MKKILTNNKSSGAERKKSSKISLTDAATNNLESFFVGIVYSVEKRITPSYAVEGARCGDGFCRGGDGTAALDLRNRTHARSARVTDPGMGHPRI